MEEHLHSLLKRQLKKFFRKEPEEHCPEFVEFMQAVNSAYHQFDEDREMLERSMELSSHELFQANSELHALFRALPDIFFRVDGTGKIIDYKGGSQKEFILSPSKLIGKRIQDAPDKKVAEKFQAAIDSVRKNRQKVIDLEYDLVIDGNKGYYEARFIPFMRSQVIVITRNITGRKRAEKELASQKERLAVTLRSIGDGVITTDTRGKVILVNQVAEQLTGWSQQEASGHRLDKIFRVIDQATRDRRENVVELILETGETVNEEDSTILIARDGTERLIAHSGAPIIDNEGNIIGIVLVLRDITEKRKLEEDLLRAQKLDSIGILAGGIAHDFNNILTAVLGNITLAQKYAGEDPKLLKRLRNSEKASNRAKDLVQRLVTFATGGAPVRRSIEIKDLLVNTIEFTLAGSNIRPEFHVADQLRPVEVDENQFAQAINNLVINAIEAMPGGGGLVVTAENYHKKKKTKSPPDPGEYIRISIRDSGGGISPLHMNKIFDPYFSTKEKGSGLGLTSSYSIIKKHSGHLEVESFLGEGTTVTVCVPVSRKDKELERQSFNYKRDATILIMDDNEEVRETAGDILRADGFSVFYAAHGDEAVEIYKKSQSNGAPFDLVIMDLTIPGGKGGKEAVKLLKDFDPRALVIVSSGYSSDPVMADFKQYGFDGVVTKPYVTGELLSAVKEVLSTGTREKSITHEPSS